MDSSNRHDSNDHNDHKWLLPAGDNLRGQAASATAGVHCLSSSSKLGIIQTCIQCAGAGRLNPIPVTTRATKGADRTKRSHSPHSWVSTAAQRTWSRRLRLQSGPTADYDTRGPLITWWPLAPLPAPCHLAKLPHQMARHILVWWPHLALAGVNSGVNTACVDSGYTPYIHTGLAWDEGENSSRTKLKFTCLCYWVYIG